MKSRCLIYTWLVILTLTLALQGYLNHLNNRMETVQNEMLVNLMKRAGPAPVDTFVVPVTLRTLPQVIAVDSVLCRKMTEELAESLGLDWERWKSKANPYALEE